MNKINKPVSRVLIAFYKEDIDYLNAYKKNVSSFVRELVAQEINKVKEGITNE